VGVISILRGYPLVICYIAIENGTVIVDLPIKIGGSFHSYVAVYRRVTNKFGELTMTTFHNLYRLIFFYKPEDEYP
jgi:hypothetical protein